MAKTGMTKQGVIKTEPTVKNVADTPIKEKAAADSMEASRILQTLKF